MKTTMTVLVSVCLFSLSQPHLLLAQDEAPIEAMDPIEPEPMNHMDDPDMINTNAKDPIDPEPLEAPMDNGGATEFTE